jgi:hypothetical protein
MLGSVHELSFLKGWRPVAASIGQMENGARSPLSSSCKADAILSLCIALACAAPFGGMQSFRRLALALPKVNIMRFLDITPAAGRFCSTNSGKKFASSAL